MTSELPVTQEDRKWVYDMLIAAHKTHLSNQAAILAGEWDGTDEVQFIARHRIAAINALPAVTVTDDMVYKASLALGGFIPLTGGRTIQDAARAALKAALTPQ